MKGCITLEEVIKTGKESADDSKVDIDVMNDLCALPYSSGTTGLPKGVMLSHENLIANICQMVQPKSLEFIEPANDNFQPKTVAVLPLFHAFGLLVTSLPGLHVGGKIVLMPFEPKSFVSAMERTKVR